MDSALEGSANYKSRYGRELGRFRSIVQFERGAELLLVYGLANDKSRAEAKYFVKPEEIY